MKSKPVSTCTGTLHGVLLITLAQLALPCVAAPSGTVVAWGRQMLPSAEPGTRYTAVAAGFTHSLALKSDGTVAAWGQNDAGQAVAPLGLSNVVAVAAGFSHSLALKRDGHVVAWGDNSSGQAAVPLGLSNVVAIAAGRWHSMTLQQDGTVATWGGGLAAAQPPALAQVAAIATGEDHCLALKSNGTIVAWGDNYYRQATVPPGLANVVAIVAGRWHSVALLGDNSLAYWGYGIATDGLESVPEGGTLAAGGSHYTFLLSNGLLAAGGGAFDEDHTQRRLVPRGTNFAAISACGFHFLTLQQDGSIEDWGGVVPGLSDVVAISAGFSWGADYSAVVKSNGRVVAFGDPLDARTWLPEFLTNAVAVSAGGWASAALTADGRGASWALCENGPAGGYTEWSNLVAISTTGGDFLGLKQDGRVVWGCSESPFMDVSSLANVVAIAAGRPHSLALKNDGTVVGIGSGAGTNVPAGLKEVRAIAAGFFYSLALRSNGTVVAWGQNDYGQTSVPSGLSNVVAIAAGQSHCLALKADGTVVAWGDNSSGQASIPSGLSGVVAISAGWRHSLALKGPARPSHLQTVVNHEGGFQFAVIGQAGANYRIEVSSDLSSWASSTNLISTEFFTGTNTLHYFIDASVTNSARRFYRAVSP